MGYETKLIIGRYTDMKGTGRAKKCNYLIEIASIDLCKSDFYDTWLDKDTDTDKAFFYGTDGNKQYYQDRYSSPLLAIEPNKVLNFMKDHNLKNDSYRRYTAAIALLSTIIENFPNENIRCILYGH